MSGKSEKNKKTVVAKEKAAKPTAPVRSKVTLTDAEVEDAATIKSIVDGFVSLGEVRAEGDFSDSPDHATLTVLPKGDLSFYLITRKRRLGLIKMVLSVGVFSIKSSYIGPFQGKHKFLITISLK